MRRVWACNNWATLHVDIMDPLDHPLSGPTWPGHCVRWTYQLMPVLQQP